MTQPGYAEKLTLNPDEIRFQCKDPKHFGEKVETENRTTYVTVEGKGTFHKGDDIRGAGGAVISSCQKAEALEIQLYLARQQNKQIEFDTETFKSNVVGQLESNVVSADPNQINIKCEDPKVYYKAGGDFFGKRYETAYRITTIKVDGLERHVNDYSKDPTTKAVIPESQCAKAKAIQAKIAEAKKMKTKIDIDLKTFEAKIVPAAAAAAAASAPVQ